MLTWNDCLTATDQEIISWAEEEHWAQLMSLCQQDLLWHSEGDVWTHTKMVCEELFRLGEWSALNRSEQLQLLFAALFHDSGKPATTVYDADTNHTRSPKHAVAGSVLARQVLREMGCDLQSRERVCSLVLYHGRPTYLFDQQSPEHEIIDLSWKVPMNLMYLLALADTRGRKTSDSQRPEDKIHLWKVMAEEQGCFDRPYAFTNDHARFLFYREELSSLFYAPQEEFSCTMTILSGPPGAGKDRWLSLQQPEHPVVSLDEIRREQDIDPRDNQGVVAQAAREKCRVFLRSGTDFAFNATNTTRLIRRRWIDLGHVYHARIQIVYIEPPVEMILAQNRERPFPVPEKVIRSMLAQVEPPTWTECHALQVLE